ncbi:hypothetical protein NE619_17355 [Anaerovorax odorimutans]|uniref:DUF2892 domain-containing protein n=1 Tax=Anaerovorax odorimutans TaxID=109327 RepID=A0ABT1RTQ5_9FIRM|nr:hypothetical protein [Anaerovorax odorimutans]MCQ4638499.1 hypothetical protein [Anaerovorax odorimutans]
MADKKHTPMTPEKKNKVGNWLAIVVVLLSILVPMGFIWGTQVLFWFLIIINFVFGPCCFIGYLLEVRRGVFSYDDSEE